ncbi:MAG TPA: hypothetical protein VGA66_18445 [Mycobacterium sp.]
MTDEHREFAAEVLLTLLQRIEDANKKQRDPYVVSHAWADGPFIYLVYTAPPSDRMWGLVRDTRQSIIDPGCWRPVDDAALYYYLLDFEENQPSSSFRRPGEPDTIWWFGFPREGLPEHPSDIPETHRYTQSTDTTSADPETHTDRTPINEPRRYGNRT